MWAKRQRLLDFSWAPLKIGIENSRDLPLCVEMGVGMVMAVGIGIKWNCFSRATIRVFISCMAYF